MRISTLESSFVKRRWSYNFLFVVGWRKMYIFTLKKRRNVGLEKLNLARIKSIRIWWTDLNQNVQFCFFFYLFMKQVRFSLISIVFVYAVFVRFPFIRFPWSRRSLTVPFTVVRSVDFRGMRCSSCEVWYVLLFISFFPPVLMWNIVINVHPERPFRNHFSMSLLLVIFCSSFNSM